MHDDPAGRQQDIPFFNSETRDINPEQLLRLLYKAADSASEMILITDARRQVGEEQIIYVNSGFEKTTGYSREEVLGKNPRILQGPDTEEEVIDRLREKVSRGEHFEGETFNYRKDGTRYRVRWSIDPVRDNSGQVTHFISLQRDVTEQWERQRKLEQLVEERESLVKEIHHRIKNNLAVITGLLQLQADKSSSEEARKILTESTGRVQSIATLHEKLYNTGDFTSVSLDNYLEDLLDHLMKSFGSGETEISLQTDLPPVSLSIRQAVPCGLMLNELVTNAIQHAFEGRDKGTIRVTGSQENGRLALQVSDDGIGLPDDTQIPELDSLGLRLIETLSQQLGGSYSYDTGDDGTTFTIRFDTPESDR